MKTEFVEYLKKIGINEQKLIERVEYILNFYEKLYSGQIEDIFISEYLNEDGTRVYENLWFFTNEFLFEAKQFIIEDNFDSMSIVNTIKYWNILKKEYDYETSSIKSRMSVYISFVEKLTAILKASKENCDNLKLIFSKYFLPNMKNS